MNMFTISKMHVTAEEELCHILNMKIKHSSSVMWIASSELEKNQVHVQILSLLKIITS